MQTKFLLNHICFFFLLQGINLNNNGAFSSKLLKNIIFSLKGWAPVNFLVTQKSF